MPQQQVEESVEFSVHEADEKEKAEIPQPLNQNEPATFVGKASMAGNSMVNVGSVVPAPKQG